MAYFSNGTEGLMYEEKYCNNCVHFTDAGGEVYACAVLELHYEFNYEQGGKTKLGKAIKQVLETLIPTKKDGLFADECKMFVRTNPASPAYIQHLQAGKPPIEFDLTEKQQCERSGT
jgi:hypothetical protein